jgi:nicotinate-nucleotide pyrophosphorylase (carboxylating)
MGIEQPVHMLCGTAPAPRTHRRMALVARQPATPAQFAGCEARRLICELRTGHAKRRDRLEWPRGAIAGWKKAPSVQHCNREQQMDLDSLLPAAVTENVRAALAEDVGAGGDITAQLVPAAQPGRARIVTRDDGVFCGRNWADETCRQVDAAIRLTWQVEDAERISAGQTLVELSGPARGLLTAERTILNFLQLLSGTATQAARYVDLVADLPVVILDTRKTLPGLRLAQKYAVRCGGASNHRLGLFDAFLIKENHIAAAGSIEAAVRQARVIAPERPVEVEVETLDQLRVAADCGADIVMLDNFAPDAMRTAVRGVNRGMTKLEASGGIDFETVRAIAESGVDYISIGAITKKAIPIDLSMRFID